MKTKSKLNPKEAGKREIIVIIMEINMIENRKYNRKKKKPKAKSSCSPDLAQTWLPLGLYVPAKYDS